MSQLESLEKVQADPEAPVPAPPRLLTTVLCEDVAHSAADDAPLIYRVFLAAAAERLPHPQRLTVVTFWLFDAPGDYGIGVGVLTPEEEAWVRGALELTVERPGTYHTTSVNFGRLDFPVYGRYRVEVRVDGALAGAYPLFIQPPQEVTGDED